MAGNSEEASIRPPAFGITRAHSCMRVLWCLKKKERKKKRAREKATRERIDAEKVCRVQRCKPSYPLLRCELVLAHLLAPLLLLLRSIVFVLYFYSFCSTFSMVSVHARANVNHSSKCKLLQEKRGGGIMFISHFSRKKSFL